MSGLTEEQARAYMHKLLAAMRQTGGSDLFISNDFPPSIKKNGSMQPITSQKMTPDSTRSLAYSLMNASQKAEFEKEQECNFAIVVPESGRFRVNIFIQQQCVSMVLRTIASEIPNIDQMGLPAILKDVVMNKRGLVLLVGGTGSGKSTTLASMVDYRNASSAGHIITIEDPVEYAHKPKKSLVSHREVGVDTQSWHAALKNTLRQAPDVILIGEIRDHETMEHAIAFSETGHLCLSTLHANSASQTIERIINFFPEERRTQLLMDLSANLRAIVSQRLIRTPDGKGRKAAIEILLNTPIVAEKIMKGEFHELKEIMRKSKDMGMRTFDMALFDLYEQGHIGYEEAIRNADSANELRLNIKLQSRRGEGQAANSGLSLHDPDEEEKQKAQAKEEEELQESLRKKAAEQAA